ncbi:MAG: glycosyltransferase [Patescibacteria group bacterium]
MKTAIIHDYFIQNGGAENVIESILKLYPESDIYTSVFIADNFKYNSRISHSFNTNKVKTSFMNKFLAKGRSGSKLLKFSKHLYFLYPFAMMTLKVNGYDKVIVSSTYCGKNIRLGKNKLLIHYCHSPTRFLHGLVTEKDHSTLPFWQRIVSGLILNPILKIFDKGAVSNLIKNNCIWIANSKFIQQTIRDVYHVDSEVIYPPVDLRKFSQIERTNESGDFYLCHGRISFHKRIDLAIKACLELNKKLFISGQSAMEDDMIRLKSLIPKEKEDLITFLGRTTDEELGSLVSRTRAMLFPGKEDAGIAPIELLAAGVPVIAFKSGGALEYIQDGINGVFFENQEVEDLKIALEKFEKIQFNKDLIKKSSSKFSEESFLESIEEIR